MTALLLRTTLLIEHFASRMQALYSRFLRALDAFAEAKMRNSVPEWQLRRAQRELNRCRRLMHATKEPLQ